MPPVWHSDRIGTRNPIFGNLESAKNWVEQDFSSFFSELIIFTRFDDFPKFHSAYSELHFEKSSYMEKNWQKWR